VEGLVVIVAFFDQFAWMAYGRLLHVQAADLELLFSRLGAALDLSSMEVDRLADDGDTAFALIRPTTADGMSEVKLLEVSKLMDGLAVEIAVYG
jgi:hypothetical protein